MRSIRKTKGKPNILLFRLLALLLVLSFGVSAAAAAPGEKAAPDATPKVVFIGDSRVVLMAGGFYNSSGARPMGRGKVENNAETFAPHELRRSNDDYNCYYTYLPEMYEDISGGQVQMLYSVAEVSAMTTDVISGGKANQYAATVLSAAEELAESEGEIIRVVLSMGVNDLIIYNGSSVTGVSESEARSSAEAWVSEIGQWAESYPNLQFYVCSLYGTGGMFSKVNTAIDAFNDELKTQTDSLDSDHILFVDAAPKVPSSSISDGLHANGRGTAKYWSFIYKIIRLPVPRSEAKQVKK